MKRSWLTALKERLVKKSKTPWASFETEGPSDDGRLEFSISWNNAFVERLRKAGYDGANEEEIVQLFFISTRMLPEDMLDDEDTVNPSATPRLTSEANILRR